MKTTRSPQIRKPLRAALLKQAAALEAQAACLRDLAECEGANDGERYSSFNLPSDVSRRNFATIGRSGVVPGMVQDQPRNGWSCPREAFRVARTKKRPKLRIVPALESDAELADKMISDAGLRATARAR